MDGKKRGFTTGHGMKTADTLQDAERHKKVFLVDDHPVLRRGLKMLIEEEPDLIVCGEAATVVEAFAAIRAVQPDIAVVDLSLKEGSGLELVGRLKETMPALPALVLSAQPESRYAEPALRAGARGYLEKQEDIGSVVGAIRRVLSGQIHLSEKMTERILNAVAGPAGTVPVSPSKVLSGRELAVFELIGGGAKTHDIADQLCVSAKTVQIYRDRIREKLGLADGTELQHAAFVWMHEQKSL